MFLATELRSQGIYFTSSLAIEPRRQGYKHLTCFQPRSHGARATLVKITLCFSHGATEPGVYFASFLVTGLNNRLVFSHGATEPGINIVLLLQPQIQGEIQPRRATQPRSYSGQNYTLFQPRSHRARENILLLLQSRSHGARGLNNRLVFSHGATEPGVNVVFLLQPWIQGEIQPRRATQPRSYTGQNYTLFQPRSHRARENILLLLQSRSHGARGLNNRLVFSHGATEPGVNVVILILIQNFNMLYHLDS